MGMSGVKDKPQAWMAYGKRATAQLPNKQFLLANDKDESNMYQETLTLVFNRE